MTVITEKARAKLNLSLDVTGRRPDGYHELRTVMHTCSLCDILRISAGPGEGLRVRCDLPGLPEDGDNLAGRAAALLREETGVGARVEIGIEKHIPFAAGLGGGSADAAAVLRVLGRLWGTEEETLLRVAARVGADVPFCLRGGAALCGGIGERMEPLPPMPPCHILILKPGEGASTSAVFGEYDRSPELRRDTDAVAEALRSGDLAALGRGMGNALAGPCARLVPASLRGTEALRQAGALAAMLSGSGTASFGLFDREETALHAAETLRQAGYTVFSALPEA